MTKKDYIAIAKIIKEASNGSEASNEFFASAIVQITNGLCKYFYQDNPAFDNDKFLKACKPDNK